MTTFGMCGFIGTVISQSAVKPSPILEVIMIEKYISEFIRLSSDRLSLDDCGDKSKVRKHNAKMRKLHKNTGDGSMCCKCRSEEN